MVLLVVSHVFGRLGTITKPQLGYGGEHMVNVWL